MGVFARLLRRSKATEEASTAEAQADTPTAESEAERAEEVKASPEAAEGNVSATAKSGEVEANEAAEDESGAADDVEIPKQQTAEKAADNEAGEGARK
jgi:hypothetical protein